MNRLLCALVGFLAGYEAAVIDPDDVLTHDEYINAVIARYVADMRSSARSN